jgi:nucleoside diphosphate kinase
MKRRRYALLTLAAVTSISTVVLLRAQDDTTDNSKGVVPHAECTFFGPAREKTLAAIKKDYHASDITSRVTGMMPRAQQQQAAALPGVPGGTRTGDITELAQGGLIDQYIFQAIADANVQPAAKTSDYEFLRRVTLDLTGRIPTAVQVQTFVADTTPDKRAKLVDSLMTSQAWVDKWTMYYGDLFQNGVQKTVSGTPLFNEGRNAFNIWIRNALSNNMPYDQMARALITATGSNTYDPAQGPLNWVVGGRITGGPVQDTQDQLAANVADTFLGLANMNCVECHNGRGHLDSLNSYFAGVTRYQAWQFAAHMAHTPNPNLVRYDPTNNNLYYWSLTDNMTTDYQLGSTTGNRPARTIVGNQRTVSPVYIFNGDVPGKGVNYRQFLANEVTADFQFARATVNYMWKQFFNQGIVEPVDQFDLARLDPDNPPPNDGTPLGQLQPSNARLLNALAQSFVQSGYDIKALQRQIVNSNAYQLSSFYDSNQWQPSYQSLFARHFVRRLWSEEIHDAITQSSNVGVAYKVYTGTDPSQTAAGTVTLNWAMQLPDTRDLGGVGANAFLDAFLRGDRDTLPRDPEGSLSQALNLMNDNFVMTRVRRANAGTAGLINQLTATGVTDDQLVTQMYLNVLSRLPSDAEKTTALNNLKNGNRNNAAEDLLWSLYNKVDFIFSY